MEDVKDKVQDVNAAGEVKETPPMDAKEAEQKYVKAMLENELFAVVFPENEKTKEAAEKLAEMLDTAAGIGCFKSEDENEQWGVLIDKVREAKKHVSEKKEDEVTEAETPATPPIEKSEAAVEE